MKKKKKVAPLITTPSVPEVTKVVTMNEYYVAGPYDRYTKLATFGVHSCASILGVGTQKAENSMSVNFLAHLNFAIVFGEDSDLENAVATIVSDIKKAGGDPKTMAVRIRGGMEEKGDSWSQYEVYNRVAQVLVQNGFSSSNIEPPKLHPNDSYLFTVFYRKTGLEYVYEVPPPGGNEQFYHDELYRFRQNHNIQIDNSPTFSARNNYVRNNTNNITKIKFTGLYTPFGLECVVKKQDNPPGQFKLNNANGDYLPKQEKKPEEEKKRCLIF